MDPRRLNPEGHPSPEFLFPSLQQPVKLRRYFQEGVPVYRVAVEMFQGPLDLLLYLVRKHEVDVLDIPIAAVTDQFLEYLRTVQALDMDSAGDFVVMAATLMEIKSRNLLPKPPEAEVDASTGAVDPRQELVRQLLEYRRFKEAAAALEECAESSRQHFTREPL
ncbi:MAG: segregation and condensation protein A, partial [Gemmataceae bacterium]